MLNRCVTGVLILCLLCGCVTIFAETEESAVQSGAVLNALGLWDADAVSDTVTRGEMADILVRLLGMEEILPDAQNEIFFDIPREHPRFRQIAFLNSIGVVSADSSFEPDKPITYAETIKMLLCAMGYQRYAEERGGYPAGYLRTARERDLIPSGITVSEGESLSKSQAAVILENALGCALMEPEQFGDKISYVFDAENTLLSRYHGIHIAEGVLRNAGLKAMDGVEEVKRDQIMVDNKCINAPHGLGAASDLLGYRVRAYYRESDSVTELCCIQAYQNRVLEISEQNSPELVEKRIQYYDENGGRRQVSIPDLAELLYNDMGIYSIEKGMIENADHIELIDNGGNGYSVLRIYSYEIAVVAGVDYAQKTIYFKYPCANGSHSLNLGDGDGEAALKNTAAEDIEITAVRKDDIISVLKDKDSKNVSAIVASETVTGLAECIENKDGGIYVTIGGKEYRYSKNAEQQEYYGKLKTGVKYILRLDHLGRIADAAVEEENTIQYGFLADAAVQGSFGGEALLLMYLPNAGGLQEMKCASRVKIDGESVPDGERVIEALRTNSLGAGTAKVMPKPVKYLKNPDGEISMLNTPRKGVNEPPEAVEFVRCTDFTGGTYNTETHVFAGQVRVGSETKIFCVPLKEKDYTDPAKYVLKDYNYLRGRVYPSPAENMEIFGMSKDMTAEVIVLYQENIGGTEIDQNTPITVVSNVMRSMNRDGELVTSIEGWEKGKRITANASSDFDADLTKYYNGANGEIIESKVRKGDIIRYRTNARGEIEDYDKIFSLRDEDNPKYVLRGNEFGKVAMPDSHESLLAVSTGKHSGNAYNCNRIFSHNNESNYIFGAQFVGSFGKIKERVDNNLIVTGTLSNGKIFQEFCDTSKMTILTLDEAEDEVYASTADEIKTIQDYGEAEASDVLFFSFSAKSSNLIIVRREE